MATTAGVSQTGLRAPGRKGFPTMSRSRRDRASGVRAPGDTPISLRIARTQGFAATAARQAEWSATEGTCPAAAMVALCPRQASLVADALQRVASQAAKKAAWAEA